MHFFAVKYRFIMEITPSSRSTFMHAKLCVYGSFFPLLLKIYRKETGKIMFFFSYHIKYDAHVIFFIYAHILKVVSTYRASLPHPPKEKLFPSDLQFFLSSIPSSLLSHSFSFAYLLVFHARKYK